MKKLHNAEDVVVEEIFTPPPRMAQRRLSHATITASDRILMAVQEREMQLYAKDETDDFLGEVKQTPKVTKTERTKREYSCKICGDDFDVVQDLIRDSQKEKGKAKSSKGKYTCRLCNTVDDDKSKMSNHAIKHLKENEVHCCTKCAAWVGKLESTCSGATLELPKMSGSDMALLGSADDVATPRILDLVSQVTEKKESALSHWKKQIAASEKKMCDICGNMAITRMIKGNVESCSSCRISQAQKHKKNWRIKYVAAIRHLAPTVFHANGNNVQTAPQQFCKQCEKPIEDKRGLLNILVKEKWQKRSPVASTLSWDIMQAFYCLICGFKVSNFTEIRKHVLTHFNVNETLYCRECQQAINEICTDTIPDAGETDVSLPSGGIPILVGKASLQGVKIGLSDQSDIVTCGKCKKIFDHLLPLIQKIVEFRLEVKGSVEKGAIKLCYYYCRVCCKKDPSKTSIEKHALRHITQGEVFCGHCQKFRKDRKCIAKLVPVMVGREQSQQKDKSQIKITGTSYAEMHNLSNFTSLTADEMTTDEDAKIFQAFVLSLRNDDFEDDEILESITSSEWTFVYAEPEQKIEENEEYSHLNKRSNEKKNNAHRPKQGKEVTVNNSKSAKEITTVEV